MYELFNELNIYEIVQSKSEVHGGYKIIFQKRAGQSQVGERKGKYGKISSGSKSLRPVTQSFIIKIVHCFF